MRHMRTRVMLRAARRAHLQVLPFGVTLVGRQRPVFIGVEPVEAFAGALQELVARDGGRAMGGPGFERRGPRSGLRLRLQLCEGAGRYSCERSNGQEMFDMH